MGMKVEDVGELAYGGLVTGMKKLDENRMMKGQLAEKDILKKFETYAFLIPGVGSTLISAFGWMRRYESWAEHISHGFLYGFPSFVVDTIDALRTGGSSSSAKKAAIKEAQRILMANKQITQGRETSRTYEQEFKKVGVL